MNCFVLKLNQEASLLEQWDFGIVSQDFLKGEDITEVSKLPSIDRAVVCIAARHHAGYEKRIQDELEKIDTVVLIVCGDEEAEFNISHIKHPQMTIFVQNPHPGIHDSYHRFGTGYPKHMRDNLPKEIPDKFRTLMFAGQMTHSRRRELVDVMRDMAIGDDSIYTLTSQGFTQGEEPKDYYKHMSEAKVAPAPSGAVIPDSFRMFEALECMAIPVGDEQSPYDHYPNYWDFLFEGDAPFPKTVDWRSLPGNVNDALEGYPYKMHKITVWYIQWKRRMQHRIQEAYNV